MIRLEIIIEEYINEAGKSALRGKAEGFDSPKTTERELEFCKRLGHVLQDEINNAFKGSGTTQLRYFK